MKKFTVILFALTLLVSSMTAANVFANESTEKIGTVVAMRGKVFALNSAGEKRLLKLKSPIFKDDSIKTEKRSRIQLMFNDNTIISLGKATTMKITEFNWKPDIKKGTFKSKVSEGTFRIMGGAITKNSPKNFKTETPAATIGIRGSMYSGVVTSNNLSVVFQGGKGIEVSNKFGAVAITKPGFGTHVQLNAQPLSPIKFTSADLENLNQSLAGNGDNGENGDQEADEQNGNQNDDDTEQATTEDEQPADEQQQADGEQQDDEGAALESEEGTAAPADEQSTEQETMQEEGEPAAEDQSLPATETASEPTTEPVEPVESIYNEPIAPLATEPGESPNTFVPIDAFEPINVLVELPPVNELPSAIDTTSTDISIPTDGLSFYMGGLSGLFTDYATGLTEPIVGDLGMEINWFNHKALGVVFDAESTDPNDPQSEGSPIFFFGSLEGSTLTNVKIFGADGGGPDGVVSAIEGIGSGILLGTNHEFFNLSGSGADYNIKDSTQPTLGTWEIDAGTNIQPQNPLDLTAPRNPGGVAPQWEGFLVGVSEDMVNIDTNRRLFMNTQSSDFSFTTDRDAGTISGSMSATDLIDGTATLNNITIGGASNSAYILEDFFAGLLTGSSTSVSTNGSDGGLKSHGNYLVTEDPDNQPATFATWGYWEIAYTDPDSSSQYHAHLPGTMWVAGEKTPTADVNTLKANDFTGVYSGKAMASKIDPNVMGQVSYLKGTMNMTVKFGDLSAVDDAVTGTINLPDITLAFESNDLGNATNTGFTGISTNTDIATSSFNGAFYGPNAASIGGNFHAKFNDNVQYLGIFAGNR